MGFIGILVLSLIQVIFFASLIFLWMKMKRSMDDDSRWSRGLQFLESKIAVFEDLSDRTEKQVKQLNMMMENKICDLQKKIDEADQVLGKISQSMRKSIEVAQIFQDKIPHEEIIERQNTVKFVKAALMAHEGKSIDEIAEAVELPRSQIEFIVKVNSERLSFDTSQMPEWLKFELNKDPATKSNLFEKKRLDSISSPSGIRARTSLRPLEQILKQKTADIDFISDNPEPVEAPVELAPEKSAVRPGPPPSPAVAQASALAQGALGRKAKDMGIRPVIFPRIDMPK